MCKLFFKENLILCAKKKKKKKEKDFDYRLIRKFDLKNYTTVLWEYK